MIRREVKVFRNADKKQPFKVILFNRENGKEIVLFSNDPDLALFVADKFILANDYKPMKQ